MGFKSSTDSTPEGANVCGVLWTDHVMGTCSVDNKFNASKITRNECPNSNNSEFPTFAIGNIVPSARKTSDLSTTTKAPFPHRPANGSSTSSHPCHWKHVYHYVLMNLGQYSSPPTKSQVNVQFYDLSSSHGRTCHRLRISLYHDGTYFRGPMVSSSSIYCPRINLAIISKTSYVPRRSA